MLGFEAATNYLAALFKQSEEISPDGKTKESEPSIGAKEEKKPVLPEASTELPRHDRM